MTDIRQTTQYAYYLSKIGWEVERIGGTNYFIKKLPIVGSILKLQRPEEIRYKDIRILSKKYKTFQIIIEPKNEYQVSSIQALGFRLSRNPYLPTKTLQLNLTKSENQLLREMKKDARLAIRKTKNLRTEEIKSPEEVRNAWKKAVGWKRYVPPLPHLLALKKSFKENCVFYCYRTVEQDSIDAGGIFLLGDGICYYWQAFTNKKGRRAQAQYKIVWEGIRWAKKMGAKVFDFEGIYDERFPNKSWLGFTHFKKSFGGYEVSYPGTYAKFRLPI